MIDKFTFDSSIAFDPIQRLEIVSWKSEVSDRKPSEVRQTSQVRNGQDSKAIVSQKP